MDDEDMKFLRRRPPATADNAPTSGNAESDNTGDAPPASQEPPFEDDLARFNRVLGATAEEALSPALHRPIFAGLRAPRLPGIGDAPHHGMPRGKPWIRSPHEDEPTADGTASRPYAPERPREAEGGHRRRASDMAGDGPDVTTTEELGAEFTADITDDELRTISVAPPSPGRETTRDGYARTRLPTLDDPLGAAAAPRDGSPTPVAAAEKLFPVGWLVVVAGPGTGAHFTLFNGISRIGRSAGQTVRLDFGDASIPYSTQVFLFFDAARSAFLLDPGNTTADIRLNGQPLRGIEPVATHDEIGIGETRLRLVALCGPDFAWPPSDDESR
ncbi:hypothetical protein RGUI_0574 [Rhodovulum sp. P5]|uniref:FHA domain-containing protein n=1 Tax=Rhodovulum sp. P5 TaxID=1564506 RepID=UPI0009C3BE50|nr:FHA domain-containing protein [Rhodovulum sp. P5]ARE38715.1 hypothetical protein RGUI_0574 [Rhodovulum sp. P5]